MALYSEDEKTIRQRLSRMLNDCILATLSAGSETTATIATTDPVQFYAKADDFFNSTEKYEVYCYSGTNIGVSRLASDWVNDTHVLTVSPAAGSAYTTSSKLEFHIRFGVTELRDAINQGIELFAKKYLINIADSTTITLTITERNDVEDSYINIYEYALPTDCLYLWRVITEGSAAGMKLTGTISDTLTLGETVTSGTTTGLVSYSGATYIRVREVDGAFAVGDTATGGDSGEACSAITAVDSEPAGDGKFPMANIVDPRDYTILKAYAPKIKFDEQQYSIVEDLRIKLEYQGSQATISADTDTIFLPPHDLVEVAATYLPFSKIESNNLTAVFNRCLATRARIEARPSVHPYANSKQVIE